MHFLCKASSHRNSQVSKDDSCRIARNQIVKSGSLVCCGLSVVVRGGCRAENQLKMIAKIMDTAMPMAAQITGILSRNFCLRMSACHTSCVAAMLAKYFSNSAQ